MAQNTHVLELNGRRYNAMTGALLSDGQKSVDGFWQPPAHPQPKVTDRAMHPTALRRQTIEEKPKPGPKQLEIHRTGTHHHQPHQLQHSKTLMRGAVHPPGDPLKRHLKPMSHTGTLVKASSFDIVPKRPADTIDPSRLKHAHTVPRSQLVRRFATSTAAQPALAARAAATYQQPRPITPVVATAPQPAAPAHQPSYDVFEHALAMANSHQEPYRPVKHKSRKLHRLRKITSISAATLAVFLIAGFVAYQNSAAIQLRLVSSRAGIAATLPAWQPSGFKLGTFNYGPGTVTVSYKNLDGSHFSIAQSSSSWDSKTLLSEYVYPNNETYDTINSAGTTIYTYGKDNATWVSGGIWYKLTSDGSLSTSQIVNVATSMQS